MPSATVPRWRVWASRTMAWASAAYPGPDLAAGFLEHPPTDLEDERGLFGHRDELDRRHEAVAGPVPADEGLHPHQRCVGEPDNRLVVDEDLAGGQGPAEIRLQLEAFQRGGVHRRLEDGVPALPQALAHVHGEVGAAQE